MLFHVQDDVLNLHFFSTLISPFVRDNVSIASFQPIPTKFPVTSCQDDGVIMRFMPLITQWWKPKIWVSHTTLSHMRSQHMSWEKPCYVNHPSQVDHGTLNLVQLFLPSPCDGMQLVCLPNHELIQVT